MSEDLTMRQEIEKQLEFLKAQQAREDAARGRFYRGPKVPMTGEACAGCGSTGTKNNFSSHVYSHRMKDSVCSSCRRVLMDGLNARLAELEKTEKKVATLAKLSVYGYYEGYHGNDKIPGTGDNCRDNLEHSMERLLKALSEPVKDRLFDFTDRNSAPYVPAHGGGYGPRHSEERLMPPYLIPLIDQLDEAIRLAIKDTSDSAKQKGSNLLIQLASGDMNVDEFNKAALPQYHTEEELRKLATRKANNRKPRTRVKTPGGAPR